VKCRKCKKVITKESKIKGGFCSEYCKENRNKNFWSNIGDVFQFIAEIFSAVT
jgi:hypothetical protein